MGTVSLPLVRTSERVSVCGLSADAPQQGDASQTAGRQLPDGQWMTQSYADQIPDISGAQQDGGGV